MKMNIGRSVLMGLAAALAAAVAGVQSRAGEPVTVEPAGARPLQLAQANAEAQDGEGEDMPDLGEAVLQDPEMITAGEAVWQEQCRHCHGRSAYPGKAPRLRPSRYTPEFVYHRVTFGFRGMPAWEDVYSEEERIAVTAYVLSREFSP